MIRKITIFFLVLIFSGVIPMPSKATTAKNTAAMDIDNTLYLYLPAGKVVIKLRPDLAPKHVARIKELVKEKFYDGLVFHRVIEGFMAQTGDPRGDGTGGSGKKIKAEFSKAEHLRGIVSMARSSNPDSGDSQFFICLAPAQFLDGQYTIWGEVVEGMDFVDQIQKGDRHDNGHVDNPTKIVRMRLANDDKK